MGRRQTTTAERRKLPRRTHTETRELLLLAGTLIVDETATSGDPDQVCRLFAHVTIDEVIDVAEKIQVYLLESEETPSDMSPLGVWLRSNTDDRRLEDGDALHRWVRDHRQSILSVDTGGYADMAKTIVYSVFAGEDDLHAELLRFVLSADRLDQVELLNDRFADLMGSDEPPDLPRIVSTLADAAFLLAIDDPVRYIEMGTAPYLHNPEIVEAIRTQYRASGEKAAAFFTSLLDAFGVTLKSGLTPHDVYATLAALQYGFLYGRPVDPETHSGVRTIDGIDRTLFAAAVESVISQFIEWPGDAGKD